MCILGLSYQIGAVPVLDRQAAGKHGLSDLSHAIVIARGPVKCAEENVSVSQFIGVWKLLFLCLDLDEC